MKLNVGTIDRYIRIGLAVAGLVYLFTQDVSGAMQWGVGIFSVVMAATGLMGTCPIYSILGMSTCPTK